MSKVKKDYQINSNTNQLTQEEQSATIKSLSRLVMKLRKKVTNLTANNSTNTYNLWCANGDTCTLPLGRFWSESSKNAKYGAKQLEGKYCRVGNKKDTWQKTKSGLTCTKKKKPVKTSNVLQPKRQRLVKKSNNLPNK